MDQHAATCPCVTHNFSAMSCRCGFLERDSARNFEEKHAIVHDDHLTELKRRRSLWAAAPDSRGEPLNAQMIPLSTLDAAIAELHAWRDGNAKIKVAGRS